MNPLTLVRRTQEINEKEAKLGISEQASWHANYKDSAYVYAGGLPFDLTEGDLLAVFAQYGEIVDVNLVREKSTGKSKGFAFVAYEDQRSTNLAVDNLNGAQLAGRTIRVDHVSNYKKKEEEEEEEEDEETERQKREERGVCRAFQKGECKYGDSCKFSHDEQRAADTGWGPEEERKARSTHNKFNNLSGENKKSREAPPSRAPEHKNREAYDGKSYGGKKTTEIGGRRNEARSADENMSDKRLDHKQDRDRQVAERRSSKFEAEPKKSRVEMKTLRDDPKSSVRDILDERDRGRDMDRGRDIDKDRRTRDCDREKQFSRHHRERESDDHRHARRDDNYHESRN